MLCCGAYMHLIIFTLQGLMALCTSACFLSQLSVSLQIFAAPTPPVLACCDCSTAFFPMFAKLLFTVCNCLDLLLMLTELETGSKSDRSGV